MVQLRWEGKATRAGTMDGKHSTLIYVLRPVGHEFLRLYLKTGVVARFVGRTWHTSGSNRRSTRRSLLPLRPSRRLGQSRASEVGFGEQTRSGPAGAGYRRNPRLSGNSLRIAEQSVSYCLGNSGCGCTHRGAHLKKPSGCVARVSTARKSHPQTPIMCGSVPPVRFPG
jgi:hypothetical protein